jgi:hypothetical protein
MTSAIAERITELKPAPPQGQTLRIVPVCGLSHDAPPYRLLDATTQSAVHVTEISSAGSVPELRVENTLDMLVYLMDGQELVGAKQNRILNTDVLAPAKSTITIPVSCVEQGRWHSLSSQFSTGKAASHRTRAAKSERVHYAVRRTGHHDADQGAVWNEVAASLSCSRVSSPTGALSDAYAKCDADLREFRGQLRMPDETVGLAVFHGHKFQGLDLFDRHSTLQYFWDSLVDSYAIDWLGVQVDEPLKEPADKESTRVIHWILKRVAKGAWEPFASPGEGRDFRLTSRSLTGSALVWEDKVVLHLQVFPKQTGQGRLVESRPRIHRPYGRGPETGLPTR